MDAYRTWSDEALDEHRRSILNEQERRANLAAIPEQIKSLAKVYREGGGDEAALTDALTAPEDAFDGGFDLYDVDEETIPH
ncbi:hypothetical protein [Brachybacterium sp.]|uniref:hypothetical protein n=1 Tax=Brachybacterium sp. TaxID=1891286 RepID=UPI002ED57E9A